jgi:hypothetical protein
MQHEKFENVRMPAIIRHRQQALCVHTSSLLFPYTQRYSLFVYQGPNFQGDFRFNDQNDQGTRVEVVECNALCACPDDCPNRASQKPRSVPIQIFKTATCGWGARSTAMISRGQVIGFHTG